jgi:hypothetical protein
VSKGNKPQPPPPLMSLMSLDTSQTNLASATQQANIPLPATSTVPLMSLPPPPVISLPTPTSLDLSKPPPGFGPLPPPTSAKPSEIPIDLGVYYYTLPAGLMVPLIKVCIFLGVHFAKIFLFQNLIYNQ